MKKYSYVVTSQLNTLQHKVEFVTADLLKAIEKQSQLLDKRRMELGFMDYAEFLKKVEEFHTVDKTGQLEFSCIECYSGVTTYSIILTRKEFIF